MGTNPESALDAPIDPLMPPQPPLAADAEPDPERAPRGIQSVEVGGQLLLALVRHGRPMPLKDLAREAGMVAAKAHPYLVSFGKLGLIVQDPANGRYGLGPLALQLGLIAQQQVDPVRVASEHLGALAEALGHTTAIAVWGSQGATIVRIELPPTAVHVSMRPGTVMSVEGTASGLLFAVHRPAHEVRALLADDATWDALQPRLALVREHGVGAAIDALVPGVSAMAAPVFAPGGQIVSCLTAIGPTGRFDTRWDGVVAQTLKRAAAQVSARLGALPA